MNLLKQGKTNWKYILIVLILAVVVGGGILIYQYRWELKEKIFPPPKPTFVSDIFKKSTCYCNSADDCYKNLGVEDELQYWECSENKCVYRCKETAPPPRVPGLEVEPPLCVLRAISIGWPPPLKGGKIEENSVLLEWSSISQPIEFNVYRKIASPEDVRNLDNKTLAAGFREIERPENLYDVIKNENVTSFVDNKVESGKTYLYGITGTDRICHEGNFFEFFVVSFPKEIKIWKGGEIVTVWKAEEVVKDETADWKTYRNEKIGIEFQYPGEIFGTPYVVGEGEKGVSILFSKEKDNPKEYTGLYFHAYASNYEIIPPGFGVFTGAKDILSYCPEPLKTIRGGGGWKMCKIIEIAGQKAIFETFATNYEGMASFEIYVYFNNRDNSTYKGLVFTLMDLDARKEVIRFMGGPLEEGNEEKFESDFYNQSINVMENKNLSEKDTEKLKAFNQILSTFKFCAKEGEAMCDVMGCSSCCPGLVWRYVTHPMRNKANEVVCVENMTKAICVKCGDGVCGKGEDWCICPEDCPKPRPEELEDVPILY